MLIPLLVEPWGTLTSQPRKMGKLQACERPCVRKQDGQHPREGH